MTQADKRRLLLGGILLLGFGVRLWRFGTAPGGLNQDEAFAGYEAWSLLRYGMDSAGYHNPVYLTAWGSGMNALESYLMLPFLALFGLKVWAVRLPQLLVGLLSLPALYGAGKRLLGERAALWGTLLLAICPWHVLLSRWGLESNLAPGFLLFGLCFFLRGLEDRRFLPLSALFYGLSLYAYAVLWPVLPFLLLGQGVYCARRGRLRFDGWSLAALALLAVLAAPLLLFLAVNRGLMGEIVTPLFSVPRLLYLRSGELSLQNIPANLLHLGRLLLHQSDGLPWNYAGGFGLLYPITLPFALVGLGVCVGRLLRHRGAYRPEAILLWNLAAGLAVGALVQVNVNRVNLLFPPLILLAALGLDWVCGLVPKGRAAPVLAAAYLLLFGFFARYYFTDYSERLAPIFAEGLGEAMEAAGEGPVVFSPEVYHSQVLFYDQTPVADFRATVEYRQYPAAYLSARRFTRFTFGYDGTALDLEAAYVLSPWADLPPFREAGFTLTRYGSYTLAVYK